MKVCVLGSGGFIGKNILSGTDWDGATKYDLDLLNQGEVEEYFKKHKYDVVIHCAASIDQSSQNTTYKNILMFENVVRVFKGKLLYFSSGAALRGDPPKDPYGLSKWIIDRRIKTLPNVYSLRVWGCYGHGELPTRFSAVCRRDGRVVIDKDRYFDYVSIKTVKEIVQQYVTSKKKLVKYCDLVDKKKMLLSEWAQFFGATYEIRDTSGLGEPYISSTPTSF
jgi:dTDP-4-dehydrorhamnose reductase|tara:strand:- start:2791 stop:3456 length:666 start_codon:yes stop_codon:yes gene_type:complete